MAHKKSSQIALPSGAAILAERFPEVWKSYSALGEACAEAGPLDARSRRLAKIALAVGAGLEGAVHSHVRQGTEEGLTAAEIRHVVLLAVPTLGLPSAVRAMTWVDDILNVKAAPPRKKR